MGTHASSLTPEPFTPEREREREFFIDNLLVRIHCIIVMVRWTGLAPLEFEFPFTPHRHRWGGGAGRRRLPGWVPMRGVNSARGFRRRCRGGGACAAGYRGTSLIRNNPSLGPYSRLMSRALLWS